jgi:hypothetical protein
MMHNDVGGSPKDSFEDEIISDEKELDDEHLFSEDDDEDPMSADEPTEPEATTDLAMDDDMQDMDDIQADQDNDMNMDDMSGSAEGKVEQAMDNAEDAFAELKAAFAEIMGDAKGAEEHEDDDFDAIGESAKPSEVAKPTPGENGQNTKSPVSKGPIVSNQGAKAVDIANEENAKGRTTPSSSVNNMGNVNVIGSKKAPALKGVSTPKNSDNASNKKSPVAKM